MLNLRAQAQPQSVESKRSKRENLLLSILPSLEPLRLIARWAPSPSS
jgi:hypothetical protein